MNLKILIIEDESIIALDIKRIIESMEHISCKIAKTAKEAFTIAQVSKPDLIISDINLNEDIDGIECCTILQNKYNAPIIFITAFKDFNTLKKASTINFIGYLVKPFRQDELETMVNLTIIKYELFTKKDKKIINNIYSYCHESRKLYFHDKIVELTKKEQDFVQLLIKANGSIVSYNIMEHTIWHGEHVKDATRRQLIHRFKQKVPNFPLQLIKDQGYKIIFTS